MRGYLAAIVAAAVSLCAIGPAAAATFRYNIFGDCEATCSNVGLNRGDEVFGTLTLEREPIVLGGAFDETSLTDFSMTFGAHTITKATSAGASLVGVWGDGLDTIAAMDLRAATTLAPGAGVGLVLMLGAGIISSSASCGTAACDAVGWSNSATISGLSITAEPGPAPVPLPPALAFAAAGAVALAVAGRRRRQAR